MAGFGGISLLTGLFFLSKGAWPIFGFFGLDVLALWIAFRVNYRAARAREEVSVSRTRLMIRKTSPRGRSAKELQPVLGPVRRAAPPRIRCHADGRFRPWTRHRDRLLPEPGRPGNLRRRVRPRPGNRPARLSPAQASSTSFDATEESAFSL